MAIIGKIREKSWLVLVLVGGALFAFIMGDWQSMFGSTEYEYGYGLVNGEKVDMNCFEQEVQKQQRISDMNAQGQGQSPQPINRDQVWNSFVENIVLDEEYNSLGIDVSEEELEAYMFARDGFAPLPDLAQNFKDSTGGFNAQMLQTRIAEMENSEDPQQQEIWKNYKESLLARRKLDKLKQVLAQSVYVTDLQAKDEYYAQQEVKSISFVLQRYSSVEDGEINDSDENLLAYWDEHKNDKEYEVLDPIREVSYIDFYLEPSGEDSAKFEADLERIKTEFALATNDSTFVLSNSETRLYTSGPYSTAVPENNPNASTLPFKYPSAMDTAFSKATVGDIVGPFVSGGTYNIAKVIGFTKDTINARHILLPVEQGKEAQAESLADSILAIINKDNFTELVDKYSTDQGSKVKGGELGDFFFSKMVAPFATYCVNEPIGKIGKVRSQFGIHIIEVLDRRGREFPKVAVVQKSLKASQKAIDDKEQMVYDLLFKLSSEMDKTSSEYSRVDIFDSIATEASRFPRKLTIKENKPQVPGINSVTAQNSMLKLAFKEGAVVGDLVGSPIRDKDRLILACVSGIKEKGAPTFEEMKEKVRSNYRRDKKAEILIAQMSKAKSIGELANPANGVNVQQAEVTFSAPQIRGAGNEPAIVGAIFSGLKDGETTKPIKGC
jgi:peptidyl-prolyl cis-trans isomerase D